MSKQIKLFLPTPAKLTPIQLLIMIQLLGFPKYGYEILTDLRSGFKGSWEPKTGTIYPALQSLEKRKLIASRIGASGIISSIPDACILLKTFCVKSAGILATVDSMNWELNMRYSAT